MGNSDVVKTAAAELIRAAEEAVRAAWSFWNEASQTEFTAAMQTMNEAVAQFEAATEAHKHAVAFGMKHRVMVPTALDVQAILAQWRGRMPRR